jgi:hypothetical protein
MPSVSALRQWIETLRASSTLPKLMPTSGGCLSDPAAGPFEHWQHGRDAYCPPLPEPEGRSSDRTHWLYGPNSRIFNASKRRERRIADLKFKISEDLGAFGFGEFAPVAGREVGGKMELTDGNAEEAEGGKTHGRGHLADLTISSFPQG